MQHMKHKVRSFLPLAPRKARRERHFTGGRINERVEDLNLEFDGWDGGRVGRGESEEEGEDGRGVVAAVDEENAGPFCVAKVDCQKW